MTAEQLGGKNEIDTIKHEASHVEAKRKHFTAVTCARSAPLIV